MDHVYSTKTQEDFAYRVEHGGNDVFGSKPDVIDVFRGKGDGTNAYRAENDGDVYRAKPDGGVVFSPKPLEGQVYSTKSEENQAFIEDHELMDDQTSSPAQRTIGSEITVGSEVILHDHKSLLCGEKCLDENGTVSSTCSDLVAIEQMWFEFRNSVIKYVPLNDRYTFLEGLDTLLKANRLNKLQKTFLKPRRPPQPRGEKRGRGRPRKRVVFDEKMSLDSGSQPKKSNVEKDDDIIEIHRTRNEPSTSSPYPYVHRPNYRIPSTLFQFPPQYGRVTYVPQPFPMYNQMGMGSHFNMHHQLPATPSEPIEQQMPALAEAVNNKDE
ncbi:unnamed protein product [Bursaphelenchus okinawaensis]|uniref:Uncharacterized protein n=1 Tax=Bursaphelenchus okinawaensis TaxID=465554 RepID=A0A811KXN1_9BILA|nr:unnamed protein product [Bursaphelenchus okinawaensis]CAG9115104.1 unnamed protein product [Bursaphelenchus okinawaensis]